MFELVVKGIVGADFEAGNAMKQKSVKRSAFH